VQPIFKRVLIAQCLGALACTMYVTARADIWGYVDEAGNAHISETKLDDHYQLFFKGASRLGAPDAASVADAQTYAAFARTPVFQRAILHQHAGRFEPLIEKYAKLQQLDPALVKAVIAVESSFQPNVVSAKGAVGLMQIIPATGQRYGVMGDDTRSIDQKLRDPATNLRVGTRYLHDLLALFAGDLELALAAYNAGENAVTRHDNTVPPFAETQEYVTLVRRFRSYYQSPIPKSSTPIRIVVPGQRSALTLPQFTGHWPRGRSHGSGLLTDE
jgi:soluble lytic murein transglycosylase-like protein